MKYRLTVISYFCINLLIIAQFENYNTQYLITNDIQADYSVTCLNNGNIVFAWDGPSQYIIKAKIFLKSENTFSPITIQLNGSDYQNFLPKLASLSNGGFVLTWKGIIMPFPAYASIYDSSGEQLGSRIALNESDHFLHPVKVVGLENSGFVTVWNDQQKTYYRQFDNNGSTILPKTKVSDFSWDQIEQDVCKLSGGGYLITWIREGSYLVDTLYGQMFNSSGVKLGNELKLLTKVGKGYNIADLPNDNFIITWSGNEIDDDQLGIGFQIFNQYGENVHDQIVANDQTEYNQIYPAICSFDNGGFAIFWISELVAFNGEYQIFGRLFNEQGEKIGSEFQVNEIEVDDRCDLSLQTLDNDEYIALWRVEESLYLKKYKQQEIVHELTSFNQIQPSNGVTIMPSKPLFSWESATEKSVSFDTELSYDLYIANNIEFNNPLVIKDLNDTTYQLVWWLEPDYTYYWKVVAKNIIGDSISTNGIFSFFVDPNIVGIEDEKREVDEIFCLTQNYPNPFNPLTTIKYTLAESGQVTIKVFDMLGNQLEVLVNEYQSMGNYSVDYLGSKLTSGIYLYNIKTKSFSDTKKMILLK